MTLELTYSDYKFEDVHQLCNKEIDYLKVTIFYIISIGLIKKQREVLRKVGIRDNEFIGRL